MNRRHVILLGLLMVLPPVFAGCNQTLFSEADPYNQTRIDRYYDGDSAVLTRAQRERSSEMGFGFPTGLANQ
jgi:hypothetical protein